ncbi:DNA-binding GntR family transcriptional regulator [Lipingzhangella halophila]|uniref:DNA-binding GntR family transcriptional regulator n=1 Tax=Lipingzhangella halophila TaxID=1783352 RepID=A0A7W7W0F5_9ACTN|nr:GntR family transcriptional regulator [Lipingzhangella halophila]MBB4929581.1 DNA-binding GntR family transcriptional regulator [Lipingzhangella halophila]
MAPGSSDLTGLSKSQRAYAVIKERITEGTYGPGYRLVLGQLARELDVSQVPVREAIRLLEAEGLVSFERNVGARVSAIDPTEYQHTMQTMAIVEGAATALAAPHIGAGELDRARELNERMRDSLRDFTPVEFTQLNKEFHETLYLCCPNPEMIDLVRRQWSRMATIRSSTFSLVPGRAANSVAEHEELLGLMESRADAETVERRARAHRLATLNAFLARQGKDTL